MDVTYFEGEGWSLTHGNRPVSVEGTTFFEKREDLVRALYPRKLYVLEDGSVQFGGTPPRDLLANLPAPPRGQLTEEERRQRKLAARRRSEAKRRATGKAQETIKAWRAAHPENVRAWNRRYNQNLKKL